MNSPQSQHDRHSIIVVDDDTSIGEMLRRLLAHDGFDVTTASSPNELLDILKGTLPCMLLVDVMMPGMNGFELCQRLKQDPRTANIPVALITAMVQPEDVQKGIAAGAVDYIKKPFDQDELRIRVRTQIRHHETLIEQQKLHEHLAAISSATKDAIIIIDNDGLISHWNEAAESIFGYAKHEAIGQNLHQFLVPNRFRVAHERAFPPFQASGTGDVVGKTIELAAVRKSGEEFPIELSLAATSIDDKWCAVGIVRDITKRRAMENALKHSEEDCKQPCVT